MTHVVTKGMIMSLNYNLIDSAMLAKWQAERKQVRERGLLPICPRCEEPVSEIGQFCSRCWQQTQEED